MSRRSFPQVMREKMRLLVKSATALIARFGRISISVFLFGLAVGCGGNSPQTNPTPPPSVSKPAFMYTANVQTADVRGFEVNTTTGMLTPVLGSPYSVLNPISVVVEKRAKFAYVADFSNNKVHEFAINQTNGALSEIAGSPLLTTGNPVAMVLDASGKFLYTANQGGNSVSGFTIDATAGTLSPLSGSPFAAQLGTDSVAIDPVKNRLYAANGSSDTISVFNIDAVTGTPSEIAGSPFTIGSVVGDYARTIAVSPKGTTVYVADATSWGPESTTVFGFMIDATGALTPAPGSPFSTGADPVNLTFDASGTFLYVANAKDGTVSGFAVQPNGSLTATPGSPYVTDTGPLSFGIEPSGKSLYVGHGSTTLLVFTIDPATGALTTKAANPMSGGGSAWSIAFAKIQ
jgi:6-phosphogluconolactonase (cycloisomerase 2 family)